MNTDLAHAHCFAIDFAPPPRSYRWEVGSRCSGREAATNTALERPHCDGLAPELQRKMWAQLVRWVYPCVLEWSRFHLSLTGNLQGPDTQKGGAP
jgi:hypothetical protein